MADTEREQMQSRFDGGNEATPSTEQTYSEMGEPTFQQRLLYRIKELMGEGNRLLEENKQLESELATCRQALEAAEREREEWKERAAASPCKCADYEKPEHNPLCEYGKALREIEQLRTAAAQDAMSVDGYGGAVKELNYYKQRSALWHEKARRQASDIRKLGEINSGLGQNNFELREALQLIAEPMDVLGMLSYIRSHEGCSDYQFENLEALFVRIARIAKPDWNEDWGEEGDTAAKQWQAAAATGRGEAG